MKIALITDTHWGVRNDNVKFLENSKKFLDEIFFPYIDDNEIRTVIHLGDLMDRRKFVNVYTAKRVKEDFLDKLDEREIDSHFIIGNHDTYFKNTNEVNSVKELVKDNYKTFKVYDDDAIEVLFDSLNILLVPWICDANRDKVLNKINDTKCHIAMGHFEIQGFEMFKGSVVSHGFNRSIFDKFDMVMSGHFHHRSTDGHIYYLGCHAEFTWSDYDDPKGFHIFDTDTRELTFIENPYKIFKKIVYDDSVEGFNYEEFNFSELNNCFVKVMVRKKTNHYWFEKFVDLIESSNPAQLQIIEEHLNITVEEDIINEAESTIDIFKKYIDSMDLKENLNKQKISEKIMEVYNEAINLE